MNPRRLLHWAICDKKGAVLYDEDNRAKIFGTKMAAEDRVIEVTSEYGEVLHVEKVEIS